ncbi:MAG: hypothetical protein C9355_04245 [Thalassolituus maritimus]|uniref:YtkA-like n=1 Tax=Thalassolituus maritimus TaxID=484498 RepID=A0A1N7MWN1_9GAMM|nr:hypothetical protein [Thalassolituus maritimus]TPD55267.1 MAG: hypothetical protein C9355_04245 [Thalassolituus maritimus]SIS90480.1 hypothetical protein SAMN05421686_10629 [Thalassolituus maritimus]
MKVVLIFVLWLVTLSGLIAGESLSDVSSGSERFYSSELDLQVEIGADEHFMAINRLQHWNVRLMRLDGSPVAIKALTFDGGMPAHRHGLPTTPQTSVSGATAQIKGIRFSMPGVWRLTLEMSTEGVDITLGLDADLKYGQPPDFQSADFKSEGLIEL